MLRELPILLTTVLAVQGALIEAGSVSKQFTAASILLLEQQGKLTVEDDVRKYVPELPDYGQTIKISHLLHHSSGWKDWCSVAALVTPENARFPYKREKAADSAASKTGFIGEYWSEESEARWTVVLDDKTLVFRVDRPGFTSLMKPLYEDAFETTYGLVRFRRDAEKRVTGLEVTSARARRVPFTKTN